MTASTTAPIQTQTLYMDTEKSGVDYIDDYATLPGIKGPLWHDRKIPVLGVCGEIGQGKTTFLLDIARGPISYVDVPAQMTKSHPNGWKPIDIYLWWVNVIHAVPPGRFRVIAVDVAEDIEAGLAEWVWENPLYFNHTKAQYLKMSGIYWGDVSVLLGTLIGEISSKCETFAFSNHMGNVWNSSGPTGERKSKGKQIFKKMAALYVKLQREKDPSGAIASKPSGIVDLAEGGKARLRRLVNDEWVPILPPRLPIATPNSIRQYILTPPNYSALRPEERNPDRPMTDDQRTEKRIEAAQAEAEVERLRLERMQQERRATGQDAERTHTERTQPAMGWDAASPTQQSVQPPTTTTPAPESVPLPTNGTAPASPPSGHAAPDASPGAAGPAVGGNNGNGNGHEEAHTEPATEKDSLLTAIVGEVQRRGLAVEAVQERIRAVNDGKGGSLKRLGVEKLKAILAGLTGTTTPTPTTDVAPTPSTNGHATQAPATTLSRIRDAWLDLAIHLEIPEMHRDNAFAPLLAKYNVARVSELTTPQADEIATTIIGKLRDVYATKGLGTPPF